MICQAEKGDYKQVAPLIILAMQDLASLFANAKDPKMAIPLFEHFFQLPANQYSYENTLVYKENKLIVGSIIAYDGALLELYREPFLNFVSKHFHTKKLVMEKETQKGEYYIDTLSVNLSHQGKGIGTQLIMAIKEIARQKGFTKLGLLVEENNPRAKNLYSGLGFVSVGKKTLAENDYLHMQFVLP